MQQLYGIDVERALLNGEHSLLHISALAAQLPPDSRIGRAADPDNAYTLEAVYGAACFNVLNAIAYGLGGKGEKPKPAGPKWMREPRGRKLAAQVMSIDDLEAALARFEARGNEEVDDGCRG